MKRFLAVSVFRSGSRNRYKESTPLWKNRTAFLILLLALVLITGIVLAVWQNSELTGLEQSIRDSLTVDRLFDSLRTELKMARVLKTRYLVTGSRVDSLAFLRAQGASGKLLAKITGQLKAMRGDTGSIQRLRSLVRNELFLLPERKSRRLSGLTHMGAAAAALRFASMQDLSDVLFRIERTLELDFLKQVGSSKSGGRIVYFYMTFWIALLALLSVLLYYWVRKELFRRRQLERKYRSIFESGVEGQFLISRKGHLLEVNSSLARLYGYDSPQAFLKRSKRNPEFLFPNPELYRFFLRKMKEQKRIRGLEMEIKGAGGKEIFVVLSASAIPNAHSGRACIQGHIMDLTWRRETEQNLRLFSRAIEQSSEITVITDAGGNIQYINAAFEQLTGYPKNEFLGKRFAGFEPDGVGEESSGGSSAAQTGLPEPDGDSWRDLWLVEGARNPFHAVIKSRTQNGRELYLDTLFTPIRNAAGRISHYVITARDVTQEKEMSESIRRSEEKFRTIFELAHDAMLLYSQDENRIVAANRAAEKISGYSRSEIYDYPAETFLTNTDLGDLQREWQRQVRETGHFHLELCATRKDGRRIEFGVDGAPIQIGQKTFLLIIARDRTESKRAERERQRLMERYQKLFQEDLTGDCILDSDGNILLANPAFKKMFGLSEKKERTNLHDFFLNRDGWDKLIDRLYDSNRLTGIELEMLREDGRPVFVVANFVQQFNPVTGQTEIIAYFYDLTERKKLAEQLIQSQKLESIGRLAGGIAHDFNNLLTIIQGYSTFLLERLEPDSPEFGDTVEIRKAGEKASALTRQLLAFSRKQTLQPRPVNLNDAVKNIQRMLLRLLGDDVELKTILEDDLPYILADPGHLDQIVVNLAVNARDAMPEGGHLVFATKKVGIDEKAARRLKELRPGNYVMLGISDTGVGMDEKVLPKIFDPFFTTKEAGKGTGLGLSTVRTIVTQMGGVITVNSQPGQGTIFRIYFPELNEEYLREREKPLESGKRTQANGTILLVEDDGGLRALLARMLRENRYRVLVAASAEEALRKVDQKEKLDLLITDVVLPGLNGRELADRLRKKLPAMKVLFISGYTDDIILRYGIETKRVEFLEKPFSKESLLRKVAFIMNGRTAASAAPVTSGN